MRADRILSDLGSLLNFLLKLQAKTIKTQNCGNTLFMWENSQHSQRQSNEKASVAKY